MEENEVVYTTKMTTLQGADKMSFFAFTRPERAADTARRGDSPWKSFTFCGKNGKTDVKICKKCRAAIEGKSEVCNRFCNRHMVHYRQSGKPLCCGSSRRTGKGGQRPDRATRWQMGPQGPLRL
jgi:hypothetical protein